MIERQLLSLCMITYNDANFLADCLLACQGIADEIIIADIGSTDQTIGIAEQAGAIVYQIPWANDFSAVKNFCLDHVSGSWVLFLQANEIISAEHTKKIRPLLDNPNVEGYLLYIDYNSNEYGIFSPVQSLRLLRNRREYRYQYQSFEMITDQLLASIEDADIQIIHRDDAVLSWEFQARFLLLQEDLLQHPEDSYLQYLYGIELLNRQKFEESLIHFEKAHAGANLGSLYVPHLYKCFSWALLYLQRDEEALAILNEGVKHFSFYTDLLVIRGVLYKQQKKYGDAILDLETALSMRERPHFLVPGPEIGVAVIQETLANLFEQNFNYRQALVYYLQADEAAGTNHDYLYKIGKLAKMTNSPEVLENLLNTAIKEQNTDRLTVIVNILLQRREYATVLACIDKQETSAEKWDVLNSVENYCRSMLAEAQNDLHAIDLESPFYAMLLWRQIESAWIEDRFQEAGELLLEMNQNAGIDDSLKDLCRFIHELLTGKELSYRPFTEPEYKIVQGIYENLIRLGQEQKAAILLPILLTKQDADFYIELAKPWAQGNHIPIIRTIFQGVADRAKQAEFIEKIVGQLLYHDHADTAAKLMDLVNVQLPEELEGILQVKCLRIRLEAWLDSLRPAADDAAAITILQAPNQHPDETLMDFYHCLIINNDNLTESATEKSIDLTCAEIHCAIGAYYEKDRKRDLALSAYLRALQWDPHSEAARNKIMAATAEAPEWFHIFLEKMPWIPAGSWFHNQENFITHILGINAFHNQRLDQAVSFFSKMNQTGTSTPLSRAYIAGSLWLAGKETAINLEDHEITTDFIAFLDHICRGYLLSRLGEYRLKYPYSGLIQREEEKIRS